LVHTPNMNAGDWKKIELNESTVVNQTKEDLTPLGIAGREVLLRNHTLVKNYEGQPLEEDHLGVDLETARIDGNTFYTGDVHKADQDQTNPSHSEVRIPITYGDGTKVQIVEPTTPTFDTPLNQP
jgi:hypothetical protein